MVCNLTVRRCYCWFVGVSLSFAFIYGYSFFMSSCYLLISKVGYSVSSETDGLAALEKKKKKNRNSMNITFHHFDYVLSSSFSPKVDVR